MEVIQGRPGQVAAATTTEVLATAASGVAPSATEGAVTGAGFGPGPRGPRGRGRKARRGDIRTAALLLLAEEPRNGYQIMQEVEERSEGVWRPSPGSVYPALAQLEDEGLIRSEEIDGRKLFAITDAGTAVLGGAPGRPAGAVGGDERLGQRPRPRARTADAGGRLRLRAGDAAPATRPRWPPPARCSCAPAKTSTASSPTVTAMPIR